MGNKNMKLTIITLAVLLVSTSLISAFGISSPYWETNPLKMKPGETKDIVFTLSNKQTDPVANVIINLNEGEQIASILGESEYAISPGESEKMTLRIEVPENAQIGYIFNVKFSAKAASQEETGTVQLSIGYNIDFPVEIIDKSEIFEEEPETPTEETKFSTLWTIVIVLIVLIIIVGIIIYKRKR